MKNYTTPSQLKKIIETEGIQAANDILESCMKSSAEDRVKSSQEKLESKGNYAVTTYGLRFIQDNILQLAENILNTDWSYQKIISAYLGPAVNSRTSGRRGKEVMQEGVIYNALSVLRGDQYYPKDMTFKQECWKTIARSRSLAYEVLCHVIFVAKEGGEVKATNKKMSLGYRLLSEIVHREKKNNPGTILKTVDRVKSIYTAEPQEYKKILKLLGLNDMGLSEGAIYAAGNSLINLVIEQVDGIVMERGSKGYKILMDDTLRAELTKIKLSEISAGKEYRPTIIKPQTGDLFNSYNHPALIKKMIAGVGMSREYLPRHIQDAARRMEQTPFRINKPILNLLKYLMENGHELKGIYQRMPEKPTKPDYLPAKKYFEDWYQSEDNKELYWNWKKRWTKYLEDYQASVSVNDSAVSALKIADYYSELDVPFYMPVYMDYRGRMYYQPSIFNPQAAKALKALFLPHKGKPFIEPEQYKFLYISTAGMIKSITDKHGVTKPGDKHSITARLEYVVGEMDFLIDLWVNTTDHLDFILKQEDPINLLDHCRVLYELKKNKNYLVDIFIQHDGSCNAYQHAAAYLLDRDTARLVNMTAVSEDDYPEDLYGAVAEDLIERFEVTEDKYLQSIINNIELNRDTIKKPVMCQGYGLTVGGAKNYTLEELKKKTLKDDGTSPFDEFNTMQGNRRIDGIDIVARKLAEETIQSTDMKAPAITRSKNAIQKIAEILSKQKRIEFSNKFQDEILTGMPMRFTTKDGFNVFFRKTKFNSKEIAVTGTRKKVKLNIDTDRVCPISMVNASSPNYTHSRDGEHLRRFVNKMGDTDFLMIHDSFGVIAADAPRMYRVIRETFVEQYKDTDPLTELYLECVPEVYRKYELEFIRLGLYDMGRCLSPDAISDARAKFLKSKGWMLEDGSAKKLKGAEHKKDWPDKDKRVWEILEAMQSCRDSSKRTMDFDISEVLKAPYFFI